MTNKLLLLPLLFISSVYAGEIGFYNKQVDRADNISWAMAPMVSYSLKANLRAPSDALYKSKLPEMKTIASYISEKYTMPLAKSETIVSEVYKNSAKYKLDPHLVLGMIEVESTFNPSVESQGAKGLMQIIPKYHPEEHNAIKAEKLDVQSIKGNITMGTLVLKKFLEDNKGNVVQALQKYNGSFKDKSQRYSKKVLYKMQEFTVVAKS